jgi:hypothetical protein
VTQTAATLATTASTDSSGADGPWANPNNAKSSTDSTASAVCTGLSSNPSSILTLTFNPGVPSGATINGIKVSRNGKSSQLTGTRGIVDHLFRLSGGSGTPADKKDTANKWATSFTTRDYGGFSDLWGQTWTVSQVNALTLDLSVDGFNLNGGEFASIDWITVVVDYTAGGGTFTGTGSITISAVTSSASGTHAEYQANSTIIVGPVTCAGTGDTTCVGSGAITIAAVSCAGSGDTTCVGTGDITIAAVTSTGGGEHLSEYGTGEITIGPVSCAATGLNVAYLGAGSITIEAVTCAGAGDTTCVGSGSITIDPVTSAATGLYGDNFGSGSLTIAAVTCAGIGDTTCIGTGSITISPVICAAIGWDNAIDPAGHAFATLGPVACASAGEFTAPIYTATGEITLGPVTITATCAFADFVGFGAITLGAVTCAGSALEVATLAFTASGSIAIAAVTCSAFGRFSEGSDRFPCLGGITFLTAGWLSPGALQITFDTIYDDGPIYQLYAGRSLAGSSSRPDARTITAQVLGSHWPQHLTILAVDPLQARTDYGPQLPDRPYNRVKLRWTTTDWEPTAKFADITAGNIPGGSVDDTNLLIRAIFVQDGENEYLTDPLPGSGTWNFEIAGRDETLPDGNRGTPLPLAADINAYPPDVLLNEDGSRLAISTTAGVATIGFGYDW